MTKVVFSAIASAVLLTGGITAHAQSNSIDAAVDESVRREADTLLMRQKLADAKVAAALCVGGLGGNSAFWQEYVIVKQNCYNRG